jgi:hypothetical protein
MPTPTFYELKKKPTAYSRLKGLCGTIIERGLDETCKETGKGHRFLVMPEWSIAVQQGGKAYIQCLDCYEYGHL